MVQEYPCLNSTNFNRSLLFRPLQNSGTSGFRSFSGVMRSTNPCTGAANHSFRSNCFDHSGFRAAVSSNNNNECIEKPSTPTCDCCSPCTPLSNDQTSTLTGHLNVGNQRVSGNSTLTSAANQNTASGVKNNTTFTPNDQLNASVAKTPLLNGPTKGTDESQHPSVENNTKSSGIKHNVNPPNVEQTLTTKLPVGKKVQPLQNSTTGSSPTPATVQSDGIGKPSDFSKGDTAPPTNHNGASFNTPISPKPVQAKGKNDSESNNPVNNSVNANNSDHVHPEPTKSTARGAPIQKNPSLTSTEIKSSSDLTASSTPTVVKPVKSTTKPGVVAKTTTALKVKDAPGVTQLFDDSNDSNIVASVEPEPKKSPTAIASTPHATLPLPASMTSKNGSNVTTSDEIGPAKSTAKAVLAPKTSSSNAKGAPSKRFDYSNDSNIVAPVYPTPATSTTGETLILQPTSSASIKVKNSWTVTAPAKSITDQVPVPSKTSTSKVTSNAGPGKPFDDSDNTNLVAPADPNSKPSDSSTGAAQNPQQISSTLPEKMNDSSTVTAPVKSTTHQATVPSKTSTSKVTSTSVPIKLFDDSENPNVAAPVDPEHSSSLTEAVPIPLQASSASTKTKNSSTVTAPVKSSFAVPSKTKIKDISEVKKNSETSLVPSKDSEIDNTNPNVVPSPSTIEEKSASSNLQAVPDHAGLSNSPRIVEPNPTSAEKTSGLKSNTSSATNRSISALKVDTPVDISTTDLKNVNSANIASLTKGTVSGNFLEPKVGLTSLSKPPSDDSTMNKTKPSLLKTNASATNKKSSRSQDIPVPQKNAPDSTKTDKLITSDNRALLEDEPLEAPLRTLDVDDTKLEPEVESIQDFEKSTVESRTIGSKPLQSPVPLATKALSDKGTSSELVEFDENDEIGISETPSMAKTMAESSTQTLFNETPKFARPSKLPTGDSIPHQLTSSSLNTKVPGTKSGVQFHSNSNRMFDYSQNSNLTSPVLPKQSKSNTNLTLSRTNPTKSVTSIQPRSTKSATKINPPQLKSTKSKTTVAALPRKPSKTTGNVSPLQPRPVKSIMGTNPLATKPTKSTTRPTEIPQAKTKSTTNVPPGQPKPISLKTLSTPKSTKPTPWTSPASTLQKTPALKSKPKSLATPTTATTSIRATPSLLKRNIPSTNKDKVKPGLQKTPILRSVSTSQLPPRPSPGTKPKATRSVSVKHFRSSSPTQGGLHYSKTLLKSLQTNGNASNVDKRTDNKGPVNSKGGNAVSGSRSESELKRLTSRYEVHEKPRRQTVFKFSPPDIPLVPHFHKFSTYNFSKRKPKEKGYIPMSSRSKPKPTNNATDNSPYLNNSGVTSSSRAKSIPAPIPAPVPKKAAPNTNNGVNPTNKNSIPRTGNKSPVPKKPLSQTPTKPTTATTDVSRRKTPPKSNSSSTSSDPNLHLPLFPYKVIPYHSVKLKHTYYEPPAFVLKQKPVRRNTTDGNDLDNKQPFPWNSKNGGLSKPEPNRISGDPFGVSRRLAEDQQWEYQNSETVVNFHPQGQSGGVPAAEGNKSQKPTAAAANIQKIKMPESTQRPKSPIKLPKLEPKNKNLPTATKTPIPVAVQNDKKMLNNLRTEYETYIDKHDKQIATKPGANSRNNPNISDGKTKPSQNRPVSNPRESNVPVPSDSKSSNRETASSLDESSQASPPSPSADPDKLSQATNSSELVNRVTSDGGIKSGLEKKKSMTDKFQVYNFEQEVDTPPCRFLPNFEVFLREKKKVNENPAGIRDENDNTFDTESLTSILEGVRRSLVVPLLVDPDQENQMKFEDDEIKFEDFTLDDEYCPRPIPSLPDLSELGISSLTSLTKQDFGQSLDTDDRNTDDDDEELNDDLDTDPYFNKIMTRTNTLLNGYSMMKTSNGTNQDLNSTLSSLSLANSISGNSDLALSQISNISFINDCRTNPSPIRESDYDGDVEADDFRYQIQNQEDASDNDDPVQTRRNVVKKSRFSSKTRGSKETESEDESDESKTHVDSDESENIPKVDREYLGPLENFVHELSKNSDNDSQNWPNESIKQRSSDESIATLTDQTISSDSILLNGPRVTGSSSSPETASRYDYLIPPDNDALQRISSLSLIEQPHASGFASDQAEMASRPGTLVSVLKKASGYSNRVPGENKDLSNKAQATRSVHFDIPSTP